MLHVLLAFGLAAPLQARSTAQDQAASTEPPFIYYDFVENGVLQGGRIRVLPGLPLLGEVGAPGPTPEGASTTILSNGPPSNRIDIVLVGDGYRVADLPAYAAQCSSLVTNFFQQPPLSHYKSFFNVHRVDVVSNDSGVDNDPTQGIVKDTALDMGFWCNGVERALCVNVTKALTQANAAPQRDQVLALANSTMYGGVGYPSNNLGTLAASNGAALEIALHEFGHSFAKLADEYDYGGPTTYAGGEPNQKNASTFNAPAMASAQAKWWRWLGTNGVSTFEGAVYSQLGIFRPTNNSKMRNLGRPFEEVNTEQFIVYFYRAVDPIDSATPAGVYPENTVLSVDPVDPVSHALSVQWFQNGVAIPGATGLTLNVASLGLPAGLHSISVTVLDPTPLVRDEAARAQWMTETRSWTIDVSGVVASYCTGKLNSDGCVPTVSWSGAPSVSSLSPFTIRCDDVLASKNGLLFYGYAPKNAPFQGGTLCVQSPTRRTAPQSSGGSPPPDFCTGAYSFDFNARIRAGVDANLVAGASIYGQWWCRDPLASFTVGLSNGISFVIGN